MAHHKDSPAPADGLVLTPEGRSSSPSRWIEVDQATGIVEGVVAAR